MNWPERIGRRLKLRDLHVLLAIVQSGSITKAAQAQAALKNTLTTCGT